jgi:cytochrome c5
MIKRSVTLIMALMLMLAGLGVAFAMEPDGNSRKGKYLFRKSCRSCHAEGKAAKDMSPIDLTQAQWKKLFSDYKKIPCVDKWKNVSEKSVKDIYSYMYNHAKDSPSPAKCK